MTGGHGEHLRDHHRAGRGRRLGAWSPDLPGCIALGDSETEALSEMLRMRSGRISTSCASVMSRFPALPRSARQRSTLPASTESLSKSSDAPGTTYPDGLRCGTARFDMTLRGPREYRPRPRPATTSEQASLSDIVTYNRHSNTIYLNSPIILRIHLSTRRRLTTSTSITLCHFPQVVIEC